MSRASSTTVRFTVCGVAQFPVVKVNVEPATVNTVASELASVTVASALGARSSTTVTEPLPAFSATVSEVGLKVNPLAAYFPPSVAAVLPLPAASVAASAATATV